MQESNARSKGRPNYEEVSMNKESKHEQMSCRLGMCYFGSEAERRCLPGGWREDLGSQTFKVVEANAFKVWSMRIGAMVGV